VHLDPSDDLLLEPQIQWSAISAQDLESFLAQIETFHGVTGLFTSAERDFLSIEGATTLHIDTPSLVYLQEPLEEGIVTSGSNSLWVVKESLGNIKIEGGSTQIFFESIPTQPSVITIEQGSIELNFLPALGSRPQIELIGQDDALKTIYIAGEPTSLQIQMNTQALDNGAQLSILVLDELQIKLGNTLQPDAEQAAFDPDQGYLFDADSDIVWSEDFAFSSLATTPNPASATELNYDALDVDSQTIAEEFFEPTQNTTAIEPVSHEAWVDDYISATNTYSLGQFDEFDGIVI